ncbi:MAG: hypothetical protein FD544_000232 [Pelagibacterales bacterium]|nr:hypothetical protein [Pelagibacterales bacterium]
MKKKIIKFLYLYINNPLMKKLILSIFNKKFIFFEPKKYDVLILDKGMSKIYLEDICSSKQIINEVFVDCFFKSLFACLKRLQFSKHHLSSHYLKLMIRKFKAKIIVAHEFQKNIFDIKDAKISTIVYQIADHIDLHKHILKKILTNSKFNSSPECTFYFIKHEKYKKLLNFVKTNFIISGSVKNNSKALEENSLKKYDVMFISHFRLNPKKFENIYNMLFMPASHASMYYTAKRISEYCLNKDKTFCIGLSSNRKDKKKYINLKKEENLFFTSCAPNYKTENIDVYDLASKSELIVTTYSTLGLELLSLGKKVLFLDPLHFIEMNYIHQYAKDENEGFHWYGGTSKEKIYSQLDRLLNISNVEWNKELKLSPLLIKYDKGNSILRDTIKKILKI